MKLTILCLCIITHLINAQSIECSGDCNCPNSIEGITCILNCDGHDKCKDSTLICRADDPCIVNCNGNNSCEGNSFIDGSGATDVAVNCLGENSCKGNSIINCGTNSCALSCGTGTSCDSTTVNAPYATSLSCTGSCESIPSPFVIPTLSPPNPTFMPTKNPFNNPTISPTNIPTFMLTKNQGNNPTISPTHINPSRNSSPSTTQNPTHHSVISMATDEQLTLSLQTNTITESTQTALSQTQSNMYMMHNLSVNPIYYIFITCALIVFIGACICCVILYIYFLVEQTKIAQDISVVDDNNIPKQNQGNSAIEEGDGSDCIHTIMEKALNKIEMEHDIDDQVIYEIENYFNTTNFNDQISQKEPSETRFLSADLTSCSSSIGIEQHIQEVIVCMVPQGTIPDRPF